MLYQVLGPLYIFHHSSVIFLGIWQYTVCLLQLSLLTNFYDILAEQKSPSSKEYAKWKHCKGNEKTATIISWDTILEKTREEHYSIDADDQLNELKGGVNNKPSKVEVGSVER
jgi:timeless